jgi:hypothetical protein
MVDDLISFSLSGVYSLLLLNLTFSFLLAIRVRQLKSGFPHSESQVRSLLFDMEKRISEIEDSIG